MDTSALHRRSRLLAAGYSDDELRRFLRSGALSVVRRGAYLAGPPPDDREARHLLHVRAALDDLSGDVVAGHVSAALLHGLPVWAVPLDRVHVTRARASGGRRGRRTHVHVAPLDASDVVVVHGMPVTSVARTVVDLARTLGFEQAVVVADAALALGLVTPPELDGVLLRSVGWRGAPGARRVVAFADAGSESVGESRSRVALSLAGLPAPTLQWEVTDPAGRLIGRTDFGWPAERTVGEFDGRIKYGRLLRPGQESGDAVFAEKVREDALRAQGLEVVRWTWTDLTNFAPVATRLRARFHGPDARA